jgi:hypothetical protein
MEFVWFMFRRLLLLVASLCVALGPLLLELESFDALFTPQNLGVMLPIIGGVIMAWVAKSPLESR